MNGQRSKTQFLRRSILSSIQNEDHQRNIGSFVCVVGAGYFPDYFPDHFYPINALLADTGTNRAGYFYKDRQAMDERMAHACRLPHQNKRQRKFFEGKGLYRHLQS